MPSHLAGVASQRLAGEIVESRWEAAPATAAVIALQAVLAVASLAQGWTLAGLPGWVWR